VWCVVCGVLRVVRADHAAGNTQHGVIDSFDRFINQVTVAADQLNLERHLPNGVGRATQARVEGANAMLDPVENAFAKAPILDIGISDLADCAVHGQVVLAGRNDQIYLL
jgi:hypothetical protein